MKQFTHSELVKIAHRWVLKNASCGVAFKELVCLSTQEIPDVIGFGAWKHSVMVECKISRSDYLSDKKKPFRINAESGVGKWRFYCVPEGLIKKEELPNGWGLLYVSDNGKCRAYYNPYVGKREMQHPGHPTNILAEMGIMYSALRRLHLRGRIEEIYDNLKSENSERKLNGAIATEVQSNELLSTAKEN